MFEFIKDTQKNAIRLYLDNNLVVELAGCSAPFITLTASLYHFHDGSRIYFETDLGVTSYLRVRPDDVSRLLAFVQALDKITKNRYLEIPLELYNLVFEYDVKEFVTHCRKCLTGYVEDEIKAFAFGDLAAFITDPKPLGRCPKDDSLLYPSLRSK